MKKTYINLLLVFIVTACAGAKSGSTPSAVATATNVQAAETPTPIIVEEMQVSLGEARSREHYVPFEGCFPTRLHKGDYVYITGDETRVGIRSYPDVHPGDNFIARTQGTELVNIVGGPYCSYEWVMWKVVTSSGSYGWIPESDGDSFWLSPIDGPIPLPDEIRNDPGKMNVFSKISGIMRDPYLSDAEKRDKVLSLEQEFGKPYVMGILKYAPVYNSGHKRLESFESYWRTFASTYGTSAADSLIETDPFAAGYRVFMSQDEAAALQALESP
jgi:hypothetical protein